ncbi:MAG: hypothetical protein R3E42_12865 [Burkholderiaceae bacterium]
MIGCPHADFGEGVVAVVVPQAGAKLDASTLTQAIKAQIAGFKVPKHLFIVDELPRNVMGKVQKSPSRNLRQGIRHQGLTATPSGQRFVQIERSAVRPDRSWATSRIAASTTGRADTRRRSRLRISSRKCASSSNAHCHRRW